MSSLKKSLADIDFTILGVTLALVVIGILYPFVLGAYYAFLNYAAVNPDPFLWGAATALPRRRGRTGESEFRVSRSTGWRGR